MDSKYSYSFTEKAEQDFDEILRYISFDLANHDKRIITIIRVVYGKRNLDEIMKTI